MNFDYLPPGYGATASGTVTVTPMFTIGLARSWSVVRTPSGAHRWEWSAAGPKGTKRGYAHSKAVAEARALRAYDELA